VEQAKQFLLLQADATRATEQEPDAPHWDRCEPQPRKKGISKSLSSKASAPATNRSISLPIAINGHVTSLLIHLHTTKNLIHPRILGFWIPLRRQYDSNILLSGKGQKMEVKRACNTCGQ
jgi:hypothetical protein